MNRSSVAIALAGVLAAFALVFACAGLFQPLFWPAAAASGASSYLLWRYGTERILAAAYGEAGTGGPHADRTRRKHRRVETEDWHHGGFEYRTGDADAAGEWDDWRWSGSFWREDPRRPSAGADGERVSDGGRRGGDRNRDDRTHNWWSGWEESGGDRSRDDGRGSPGGSAGGRGRGGQTTVGQRQVSRRRREAAEVLGVAPDADPETVRAAYRERVKEVHPDCGGDDASFRKVRWAYEQLRE